MDDGIDQDGAHTENLDRVNERQFDAEYWKPRKIRPRRERLKEYSQPT